MVQQMAEYVLRNVNPRIERETENRKGARNKAGIIATT